MRNVSKIRRICSVLLVFAMLLPCLNMTARSADIPCAQDGCSGKYRNGICSAAGHYEAAPIEDKIYRISNAGQLYWFTELVNAGASEYNGDNGDVYDAVLTADITINADLEGEALLPWTPIGLYTSATEYVRYSGTFDGAGHTIFGLYYDNTAYTGRVVGLFGCLDSNGVVKNLTLADSRIQGAADIGGLVSHNYGLVTGCTQAGTVTGTGAAGGVVCRNLDGGRVENCRNTGSVTGAAAGGIAAENCGAVASCENSGTVTGTSSVGGIIGMNSGFVSDSRNTANVTGSNTHVGGIAGNHTGGAVTGCGNSGAVTGGSDYLGGVAGICSGADISESFNTGSVTGTDKSDAVGGIVGAIDGTNTAKSSVTNCYNTGSVTGRSWVGGIAGVSGYQRTPQTVGIANCYNAGAVSGASQCEAVIGSMNKGTVSGVYYLKDAAQNTFSAATEASVEQFASGEIAYLLNGSTDQGELVWKQTLGTDAYPNFEGAVVSYDSERGYFNPNEKRENPFTDVDEAIHASFLDAIVWAVDEGITTGTGDGTTFEPNGQCQRAAVVTFLWRASGCPKPITTENPFTDVSGSDFFYEAVLWAAENGITDGVSATEFAPDAYCTRTQVVTFLWRANKTPKPAEAESIFDDVTDVKAYYYDAVLWAVENGITNGMSETMFGINDICNRAQIVTFLYRASK